MSERVVAREHFNTSEKVLCPGKRKKTTFGFPPLRNQRHHSHREINSFSVALHLYYKMPLIVHKIYLSLSLRSSLRSLSSLISCLPPHLIFHRYLPTLFPSPRLQISHHSLSPRHHPSLLRLTTLVNLGVSCIYTP